MRPTLTLLGGLWFAASAWCAEPTLIAGNLSIAPGGKHEARFAPPAVAKGQEAVLVVQARVETPKVAGYTPALRVELNGTALDIGRLANWRREEPRLNGKMMSPAAGDIYNLPYAPDFDAANRNSAYGLRSGPKLGLFEFRVGDLLKPGQNTLVLKHAARPVVQSPVVASRIEILVREAQATVAARRAAPQGPLAEYRPAAASACAYTLNETSPSTLSLRVGDVTLPVRSEFSTPDGKWQTGSNRFFEHQRTIKRHDEAIVVEDVLTNRTDDKLPLVHRHIVTAAPTWKQVWVAGASPADLTASASEPAQPTAFAITATHGVGLLALDDVTQVHVTTAATPKDISLADRWLVLPPRATHRVAWAIVVTPTPDYWAMLNAVRRLRNVNFTLQGSFAFLRGHPRTIVHQWNDQQFADFIRFKNAHFLCANPGYPGYQGRFPFGTAFPQVDFRYLKAQIARIGKIAPAARQMVYFHTFLDVADASVETYRDARLLLADGTQGNYGKDYERIYVPTSQNQFGRDVARNVELILKPQPEGFGCDGVYWDEFEYSRYPYTYLTEHGLPWDGVSGDIDPKTFRLLRLKSSVTLLSQDFRLAWARRILDGGHALVANSQPHTRTMAQLHFPRFVETGSISNCLHAQLFSPIALGDHLTERSELDAYRVMLRALDFGCLYYWYNDVTVVPTHPHLTSYMFPITPLELHEGWVLGRERIITKISGRFGWGDRSAHEVHVFDDQGVEQPGFAATRVEHDGCAFTELRLPEDYSAAIIRR